MQQVQFEESLFAILEREPAYDIQAYLFLRDALDYTMKRVKGVSPNASVHVAGPELVMGFHDYALEQFGPMAITLLEEWGVRESRDVGKMVFELIEEQIFGKQESDSPDDFEGVIDFQKSLRAPFLPRGKMANLEAVKADIGC